MTHLPPEIEQADVMLARVASLNLQAAEHVHACLLETTKADEIAQFSRAATQLSRSMRQCLALLARMQADRVKAAREADQHAEWLKVRTSGGRGGAIVGVGAEAWPEPDLEELAAAGHLDDVQTGVGRIIAHVAGGDPARETALAHRLDRELDDWWDQPDFLDHDVDKVIRHACRVLDLPQDLADRWRDLPAPAFIPDPAPRAEDLAPDRPINWPPDDDLGDDALRDDVGDDHGDDLAADLDADAQGATGAPVADTG